MNATDQYTLNNRTQLDHMPKIKNEPGFDHPALSRSISSPSVALQPQQEHQHGLHQGSNSYSAIQSNPASSNSNSRNGQNDQRVAISHILQPTINAHQITPNNSLAQLLSHPPSAVDAPPGSGHFATPNGQSPSQSNHTNNHTSNHHPSQFNQITSPPNPLPSQPNELPSQSNHHLALSSIVDMNSNMNVKRESPTPSQDPNLDEDAPHEDDDEEGSDTESPFINMPIAARDTCQDGPTHSHNALNNPDLNSHSQIYNHAEMDQEYETYSETAVLPDRKRKRNSAPTKPTKTPTRRESGRPRQTPRVKSAEQLASEAIIEQQNPHASKNELRSLKLRALHAGRIAERELNMPEAEKQRRQRLREYVRRKRDEERRHKAKHGNNAAPDAAFKPRRQKSGNQSSQNNTQVDHTDHQEETHPAIDTRLPLTACHPNHSQPDARPSSSSPVNGLLHEPSPLDPQLAPKAQDSQSQVSTNAQKVVRRRSVSRAKLIMSPLEAEIRKQYPNASPIQLKSLKLRALHAKRIAEREQNMSEKEKTRRAKLREYMRRRRDEVRVEKGLESRELDTSIEVNPALDSALHAQQPPDSSHAMIEGQIHANDGAPSRLSDTPLAPEGMGSDDRLAAYSMMEMTNNYQHQFTHSHPPVPPATQNLHLHPLFQIPMGHSTMEAPPPYDCSIPVGYPPMAEQWSHNNMPLPDPTLLGDEVGQKALHTELEEAIYVKPQQDDQHGMLTGDHYAHYATDGQATESDGLVRLEHERMQLGEEDMLEIERARELALIAAAAAEVEHAQQVSGSSSTHHYH
ncbi:hypothetical protein PCANC_24696 [Puccinia coronata f. sp. avenae]|uniref:Uncharacterized protein n=1 Tax=Puccinia coronata f. sp. avenae TaxID=200324 RepID=A0A2N5UIW2_9BASI|nr:hypothetical protein PCANC_24696 [Puccinia coronata f. sp. avenae]PLW37690.1 hypothetical protein PCASD_12165 [Puccinia coronata f. sp. avenae]